MSQDDSSTPPVQRLRQAGLTKPSTPPRTQAGTDQRAQRDGEAILTNLKKHLAAKADALVPPNTELAKTWTTALEAAAPQIESKALRRIFEDCVKNAYHLSGGRANVQKVIALYLKLLGVKLTITAETAQPTTARREAHERVMRQMDETANRRLVQNIKEGTGSAPKSKPPSPKPSPPSTGQPDYRAAAERRMKQMDDVARRRLSAKTTKTK